MSTGSSPAAESNSPAASGCEALPDQDKEDPESQTLEAEWEEDARAPRVSATGQPPQQ